MKYILCQALKILKINFPKAVIFNTLLLKMSYTSNIIYIYIYMSQYMNIFYTY